MPAIRHDDILLRLVKDVSYIRSILNRVTVNLPLYDVANENTPAQLTGDQNDYNIGNYDVLRLSSSLAVSITGLRRGVKGRSLRIFNIGSYPITLEHQNAGSTAEYRFKFSNAANAVIPPSSNMIVYYDATQERWIGGDTLSSGAVFATTYNTNAQTIANNTTTKIDPGTVQTDQYGFYDDANNRYVMLFDGYFVINFWAEWDSIGAGGTLREIEVWVNGSLARDVTQPDIASQPTDQEVSHVNYFSAGDLVEFKVRHINGGNLDIIAVRTSLLKIT